MRHLVLVASLAVLVSCNDIAPSPTAPPAPQVTTSGIPTRIGIVASPGELPVGGGSARIFIETVNGSGSAPLVRVNLASTEGTLSESSITTDATGHGSVRWDGTKTSTITATAGELTTTMDLRVHVPQVFPPSTPPPPRPPPELPPTIPPAPAPPGLTLSSNSGTVAVGSSLMFTAAVSELNAGETVLYYQWDLDGDGDVEKTTTVNTAASPVYDAHGPLTARVNIATSTGRTASAGRGIVVTN